MNNKYNDYTKLYNELAEMLEEKLDADASNKIFQKLGELCNIALNINLDEIKLWWLKKEEAIKLPFLDLKLINANIEGKWTYSTHHILVW